MDYNKLKQYERKAPSYALVHRPDNTDYEKHLAARRYLFDPQIGGFRSKAPVKDNISMLFSGDLLCQERMLEQYTAKDGGYDFSLCFQYLKPLFESADFVAGNLETPISHTAPYRGEIFTHQGPYFCNAPTQYLDALSDAGFDMLTTENNHTLDTGVRGLAETIENINKRGIIQTGTFLHNQDKFVIVDVCGFRVGFTAFGAVSSAYDVMRSNVTDAGRRTLLNVYSPKQAKTIYREMKKQGVEYTVCFPHWGREHTETLHQTQLTMANELTEMGYDLVLGSHSHVLQMFRLVNKKPVVYCLGNLVSHAITSAKLGAHLTTLVNLKLERTKNGIVPTVSFIPCQIVKQYKGIPFTVLPVVESLGLSETAVSALRSTTKTVTSRLKCKSSRIMTDYPIPEKILCAFEESVAQTAAKLANLRPVEYNQPEADPIKVPKKFFWQKFDGYAEVKDRLYKIFPTHAELLLNNNTLRVMKLPAEVEDRPVTIIRGGKKPNNTAKLIYLGAHVTQIDDYAFMNHTCLESVRLQNKVTSIGNGSFSNCSNMTGIILPPSMVSVGEKAFANCVNLRSITIPASVTQIAPNAFTGCKELVIYCDQDSFADTYAKEQHIACKYLNVEEALIRDLPSAAEIASTEDLSAYVHPFWQDPAHRMKLPMGPMNGPEDKHPVNIIAACYYLGHPLPHDAKCGNQPSFYIGADTFDGTLEAVKKALGDRLPRLPAAVLAQHYSVFRAKFQNVTKPAFTNTDLAVYFTDWLLFARLQGFNRETYFDCEIYNKDPEIRATFLVDNRRFHIWKMCTDIDAQEHFRVKANFNRKFHDYVSRDSCNVKAASFQTFRKFLEKHPTFFAKPQNQAGGKGARVLSTDTNTPEELYEICKSEMLLAEEIIEQHADIAAFNASTLNTIRVVTLITAENKPMIVWALVRFGRQGSCADNFHAGGVCATLNPDTGVIVSDAIDQYHNLVTHHPDSGLQFCGFQYPHWEAVKKFVLQAALEVPLVRHVGWDVAITKDGTPKLVEGNTRSGSTGLQSTTQTGFNHLYEQYINEIQELTNTPYTPAPLPDLDISYMETH